MQVCGCPSLKKIKIEESEIMRKKIGSTSKDLAILVVMVLFLLLLIIVANFGLGIQKNDTIYILEY
ncbi:hypothetical protein [Kurthia huakuii]|uniref:hypothetical protein n=1 Tax=Kurthia huakuii TaxID=1421019 RepID=UPI00049768B0|nr:hypothetical protein [Kurthia huakuii]MBM7699431.1 hypothetical protein [Kurthia huakuii]